ncbi:MAG: bifunctional folylpolyglutamate synthase/dihydrofolate synthase [Bacteroidetes bacterium]|nr:MAG: bifunctional folylpolyglutamate synthase/dihydrofolate synthase [Bacteroidota bacterium]
MLADQYQKTITWLFNQFPSYQLIGSKAYKPTLDNTKKMLSLIGHPEKELKFVHIAGSNGKGSVSAMTASIFTAAGYKTGLFTSPHISDFRERIRVNGQMINEKEVIDFCHKVQSFDLEFSPSFFEVTFAMALEHFKNEKCDICIIETGLGGRLDATNVITPEISVITTISLEHTAILGDTIEKIAEEKAGIIKSATPVLIGKKDPSTELVFKKSAEHVHAPLFFAENLFHDQYTLPFLGEYQKENLNTVLNIFTILQKEKKISPINTLEIQKGLNSIKSNTGFFGRMEIISELPLTILDVSHNPEGIAATLSALKKINKGSLHILYGSSADKEVEKIIELFPKDSKLYLTTFRNERSLTKDQLERINSKMDLSSPIFENPKTALSEIQSSANKEDTIIVFGSFFLISDIFA